MSKKEHKNRLDRIASEQAWIDTARKSISSVMDEIANDIFGNNREEIEGYVLSFLVKNLVVDRNSEYFKAEYTRENIVEAIKGVLQGIFEDHKEMLLTGMEGYSYDEYDHDRIDRGDGWIYR